jgi:phosphoglycolate phosphatase
MKNSFDLYIFDLDGTLLDTLTDVHQCINLTLKHMGLDTISRSQAQKALGPSGETFARITLGAGRTQRLDEFLIYFRPLYFRRCLENTHPFPGIVSALQHLDSRIRAIATNKPLSGTVHLLNGLNMLQHFHLIVGPEMVTHLKPHPDMIHYALAHCDATPRRTLMIGDTENDLYAAEAAGIRSCLACWGYSERMEELRERADYAIDDPGELLDLVP